jgi:hypothetical protein
VKAFVIDTNVAIVADAADEAASAGCIQACHDALVEAVASVVCLDDGQRILMEYIRQVGLIGRPGMGRQFVKWIHERQAMPQHCELVPIHPNNLSHEAENYEEFPDDPELASFDPSDRKFVAVALASKFRPPVLNATDSDWWNDREALERNGVVIQFLCPDAF